MFTNEDYERLLVKYTSQGIPAGESIQHFCDRHKVPYNLFDKWYRDTRHKVVKVKVDGMPTAGPASGPSLMESIIDEIKLHAKPSEREAEWTEDNPKPGSVAYLDQHRGFGNTGLSGNEGFENQIINWLKNCICQIFC